MKNGTPNTIAARKQTIIAKKAAVRTRALSLMLRFMADSFLGSYIARAQMRIRSRQKARMKGIIAIAMMMPIANIAAMPITAQNAPSNSNKFPARYGLVFAHRRVTAIAAKAVGVRINAARISLPAPLNSSNTK